MYEFYSVEEFEVSFSNKLCLLPAKPLMLAFGHTRRTHSAVLVIDSSYGRDSQMHDACEGHENE